MDPEIRLLRYFVAVAEDLNFSRAAERLHIAQPSLSAQIRALEGELGVQLFQRTTRSVSLTAAGRALLDRAPTALAGVERAWEAARDAERGDAGTLRLAYPLSAAHDTAPRLVQALHDTSPRVTVTTEVLPTPTVLRAVREGRADAGIARAAAPLSDVRLLPLRHDELGVLVAADHPLAEMATVALVAVADYPVVLHPREANPAHYDFIVGLFASRRLQPCLIERDIAFDLSQSFIVGGRAGVVIGRSSASGVPGTMRWIPLEEGIADTMMLVLPDREPSGTAERFEQIALAHASDHRWLG